MNKLELVIYQANPQTGELVGPSYADRDPLEPEKWLIPALAFVEEPPKPKPGQAVMHLPDTEHVWSLVQDLRGTVYRKANGQAIEWTDLGALPDDLTVEACPGPYYVWGERGWQLDEAAEVQGLTQMALAERDGLLIDATTRLAPLQDAVDLGDASPGELAELAAWKRYRVALNRVQQQPDFPKAIEWPSVPNMAQDSID